MSSSWHRPRPARRRCLDRSLTTPESTRVCLITVLITLAHRPEPCTSEPAKEVMQVSIVAERVDVVIGVDTHKHTHTAALVLPNGGIHTTLTMPADPDGYSTVFNIAREIGARRVWSIEGCGSWG